MAKEVKRENITLDAAGKPLGRIATDAARYLQGKHKPTWAPNIDAGAAVTIAHLSHARFTGNKMSTKKYYKHTNYPGNMKIATLKEKWTKNPERVFEMVVSRMLPKNKLRKQMMKRLTFV